MSFDPLPYEMEARMWLKDRSIEEALEEAEITEEECLRILLSMNIINLPPWLEDWMPVHGAEE